MRRFLPILVSVLAIHAGRPAVASDITPEGRHLAQILDSLHVDQLWLSEHYVNWKTGKPLDKQVTDGKHHSHCSAFAAAACAKFDVYILRPPEHSTVLLANAQYDWLPGEGRSQGWKPVRSAIEAQRLANQGHLVVAAYREADGKKAGHIAIVRPSTKADAEIERDGPQIIQAGLTNYPSTTLKEGFRHHPAAWRDHQVRFYSHDAAK